MSHFKEAHFNPLLTSNKKYIFFVAHKSILMVEWNLSALYRYKDMHITELCLLMHWWKAQICGKTVNKCLLFGLVSNHWKNGNLFFVYIDRIDSHWSITIIIISIMFVVIIICPKFNVFHFPSCCWYSIVSTYICTDE